MTHIAAARAAALALSILGVGAASETLAFADDRRPCTSSEVNVDENARKVTVSFKNRCEVHVGCHVRWTLCCGKGKAEAREEQLRIEGGGENAVVVSAMSCEGDWRISAPTWRCDDPDDQPASESTQRSSGKKQKKR